MQTFYYFKIKSQPSLIPIKDVIGFEPMFSTPFEIFKEGQTISSIDGKLYLVNHLHTNFMIKDIITHTIYVEKVNTSVEYYQMNKHKSKEKIKKR